MTNFSVSSNYCEVRRKRTSEGNKMHIGVFELPGYVVAILVIVTVISHGTAVVLSKLSIHTTALAFAGIGVVTELILLVTWWSLPGAFGGAFYLMGFFTGGASLLAMTISVFICEEVVENHPKYRK